MKCVASESASAYARAASRRPASPLTGPGTPTPPAAAMFLGPRRLSYRLPCDYRPPRRAGSRADQGFAAPTAHLHGHCRMPGRPCRARSGRSKRGRGPGEPGSGSRRSLHPMARSGCRGGRFCRREFSGLPPNRLAQFTAVPAVNLTASPNTSSESGILTETLTGGVGLHRLAPSLAGASLLGAARGLGPAPALHCLPASRPSRLSARALALWPDLPSPTRGTGGGSAVAPGVGPDRRAAPDGYRRAPCRRTSELESARRERLPLSRTGSMQQVTSSLRCPQ
jgi:hypothetical protein